MSNYKIAINIKASNENQNKELLTLIYDKKTNKQNKKNCKKYYHKIVKDWKRHKVIEVP